MKQESVSLVAVSYLPLAVLVSFLQKQQDIIEVSGIFLCRANESRIAITFRDIPLLLFKL